MFPLELQKEVREQFFTLVFLTMVYKEFKNKAMKYEKIGDIRQYQKWSNIAGLIFELIKEK